MFHKHKFIKEGLNLWCECGKIKGLQCSHKWKVHSENMVDRLGHNQLKQTLICECGDIMTINLTTGEQY